MPIQTVDFRRDAIGRAEAARIQFAWLNLPD
jgi:hypothetical protein